MIELLTSNAFDGQPNRFEACLSLRKTAQKAAELAYGQTHFYSKFIDSDDGPFALHVLSSLNCGHIQAYARLVPSEEAQTDDLDPDQSAITTFRWVEPAAMMLLQRVSIAAAEPERRTRILKEMLLAAVEVSRQKGMELLGGLATPDAINELSSLGIKVVTVGKQYEDCDRILVRYHFACDDYNRAVLRPLSIVNESTQADNTLNDENKLMKELARLAAAHQTRTQVKVALRLVSSNTG